MDTSTSFFGRHGELSKLDEFIKKKGSQLTFVRGRRRIGKSRLLQHFLKRFPLSFYFMGAREETGSASLRRMIIEWERLTGVQNLVFWKDSALTWKIVFQEIEKFARTQKKSVILVFDEIQWIANTNSGFVSAIKEAWQSWEIVGNIKVIMCGSSSKFFSENVGGDEKILRGLKTYASIWVNPFTLDEVKKFYFKKFSLEEVCLIYMMLGGIPYYLKQLDNSVNFIHAVNDALFMQQTIFLEEVDEILALEFNKRGALSVKKVLAALGQDGSTQLQISKKTGLSDATISDVLAKLLDYGLVFEKLPAHQKPKKNLAGFKYYMKDFFLNFYFQILRPLTLRIERNKNALLFPYECIGSKKGYYIPNFSGKAFELLVRHVLETRGFKEGIFKKLHLKDEAYEVETFWNDKTQIDLIVEHSRDRISRVIECKWLASQSSPTTAVYEVTQKDYEPPNGYVRKNYAITSQPVTKALQLLAKKKNVVLLDLRDLF